MRLAKRKLQNYNPFQFVALSGSVSPGLFMPEEKRSTLEPVPKKYYVSSEYKLSDKPTESSDPQSPISASDELYNTLKQEERIVLLKPFAVIKSRFIELQKWEGIVLDVSNNSFIGRLIDLTHNNQDSEAEFSLEEVHKEDKPLINLGAIFYWTIGYKEDRGQRIRASIVRFRRLPAWQKEEIEVAKRDAQHIRDLLQW